MERQFECRGVRLGIDMGGTLTKFLVLDNGEKRYEKSVPTPNDSCSNIIRLIVEEFDVLKESFNIERIGIGVPGVVKNGEVFADNLPIKNVPMLELLKRHISVPIVIDNDANCAALAEARLGKTASQNLVMVTIGTGIGGGIVLDGKIRQGRGGMGEICHMSIEATSGELCSCGHRGCWESYAATTALVKSAERAALEHPNSYLCDLYRQNNSLNGILIFKALKADCPIARAVFSEYLDRLAVGLKNIAYIFDPDVIVLAGGITKDGILFIDELRRRVNTDVPIEISVLQNEAGAYGAAML
jgi:glucokinase